MASIEPEKTAPVEEKSMAEKPMEDPPSEKQLASSLSDESSTAKVTDGHMTKTKLLAFIALSFTYTAAAQQLSVLGSVVKQIDEELGPTTYFNWILTGHTIANTVSLPIAGGLSDIFRRSSLLIFGCAVALIGNIISLTAKSTSQIIAATVLKGLGSGFQTLVIAAIAEIVPNRHRGNAQALLDVLNAPWILFGPLVGLSMIKYYKLSFRINFIIGLILNAMCILLLWFWYNPPKPLRAKGKTHMECLKELDLFGILLMGTGLTVFLVGLSFGGSTFPWNSVGTILPMCLGGVVLVAFGIWEWKFAKVPFFAHELFRGQSRKFTMFLIIKAVNGASSIVLTAFFSQQLQGMFFRDPVKIGLATIPGGFGGAIGGFLGGILVGKMAFLKTKWQLVTGMSIKVIGYGILTTMDQTRYSAILGLVFFSAFGGGISLITLIVCAQLCCRDADLGLASLVLQCSRSIGQALAITGFSSMLQNTIKQSAGLDVGKVVVPAPYRVPVSTLPRLIPLVIGGQDDAAARLPGSSPTVVAAAREALKTTYYHGFRKIYYTSMAIAIVALIASLISKDVTDGMTDHVAVTLENDVVKKKAGEKDVEKSSGEGEQGSKAEKTVAQ